MGALGAGSVREREGGKGCRCRIRSMPGCWGALKEGRGQVEMGQSEWQREGQA